MYIIQSDITNSLPKSIYAMLYCGSFARYFLECIIPSWIYKIVLLIRFSKFTYLHEHFAVHANYTVELMHQMAETHVRFYNSAKCFEIEKSNR